MKLVYLFSELDQAETRAGDDWDAVRTLLGGKGANLADMTRLGIPVPPGFTATTEACTTYLAGANQLPAAFWDQIWDAVSALERATDRVFGASDRPLLLSCRSGAKFSMPGMMDTVLNIGMNDEVAGRLAGATSARFAYDLFRRLVHMYGTVVLGLADSVFEDLLEERKRAVAVSLDAELSGEDWKYVCDRYKTAVCEQAGKPFPESPAEQLRGAIEAVFRSWNGKRAVDYREAAHIAHDLGTAVNVQAMVFGNLGPGSATGVCMSRDPTTGAAELDGDYLEDAQGEDVVAGVRATDSIARLAERMPELHAELASVAERLERHHRNMQDIEFTIESGKLWILQTRDGKRTAEAEVRIAVEMANERLITRQEAVGRVSPEQVDAFLHPKFDEDTLCNLEPFATGLAVSPGAAVGQIVFDADVAEQRAAHGPHPVILVRPDTKPEDVHGMLAAAGIVTSRGGRTSHAALVARQFGRPAVVGVADMEIDLVEKEIRAGNLTLREADWISLDGGRGEVYEGQVPTVEPDLRNRHLDELLSWADEFRVLGVRANADYPRDAERARALGAEGIGLCRTEHMFFETDRLPLVRKMIMASEPGERDVAIARLLPLQRADFEGLFRAMAGLPVVIRLLDPPLHEFLPAYGDLLHELAELEGRIPKLRSLSQTYAVLDEIATKRRVLARAQELREENPMLGTRGVRLGMLVPGLVRMQVRAIFEAACHCVHEGVAVSPEVMIPLVTHVSELRVMQETVDAEARAVMAETGQDVPYRFGTMIELPRAAVTAAELAAYAEFFSFGTNDLTQTTLGISRDDAERCFLVEYLRRGVLPTNPFETIDADGVGRLMEWAIREGRGARPDLESGICGEHGGDPASIALCHRLGLDYVSCSPLRVPIARLAAAQAALDD